jgi:hypothetical protein
MTDYKIKIEFIKNPKTRVLAKAKVDFPIRSDERDDIFGETVVSIGGFMIMRTKEGDNFKVVPPSIQMHSLWKNVFWMTPEVQWKTLESLILDEYRKGEND